MEKESRNQLFQTIYIQWGAYVKELRKQIIDQIKVQDSFVFDSKIAGKLEIKDGQVKVLEDLEEKPSFSFDFANICE